MTDKQVTISPFAHTFLSYLESGYQAVAVQTVERLRIERDVAAAAAFAQRDHLATWDIASGVMVTPLKRQQATMLKAVRETYKPLSELDSLQALLEVITHHPDRLPPNSVLILHDAEEHLDETSPLNRQLLANLIHRRLCHAHDSPRSCQLVFVSARLTLHDKLRQLIPTLDYPLPDADYLQSRVIASIRASLIGSDGKPATRVPSAEQGSYDAAVRQALLGLPGAEAENAYARAVTLCGGRDAWATIPIIQAEKAAALRQGEALHFVEERLIPPVEEVAACDNLIAFLLQRKEAYSPEAMALGLDNPNGFVLAGIPGSGKSYAVKVASRVLGLPLYRLDVGAIFGQYVGQSEARMRSVIRTLEAQNGCVVMIDEADKVLGGMGKENNSGVSERVFGQFLTWLAEKRDRTFAVLTLNRLDRVPPELVRNGRFDAVFYTSAPCPEERREILEIHLKKRNALPELTADEWASVVQQTDGYVGAELEGGVIESRYLAFQRRRSGVPNHTELVEGLAKIAPTGHSNKADNEAIEAQLRQHDARPVSSRQRPLAGTRHVDTGSTAEVKRKIRGVN